MKRLLALISAAVLICLSAGASFGVSAEESADATLRVSGNQLFNGSGEAVRLVGLNIPYMTWSDTSRDKVMEVLDIALEEWGSNAIRLGVTPELWFGPNSESYRATADELIEKVAAAGKYVILDNHSFYLPDDNDIEFWQDAATRYKNHPNVIFEVFNEPAGCTWQQYYEGGELTYKGQTDWGEEADITIVSCGIPKLLETIRATGAESVCILPGIDWSFDLSTVTESDFRDFAESVAETEQPDDVEGFVEEYVDKYFMKETTGNGIMYSTHPYPTKPSDWDMYLKNAALEYPILVGECGPTEKADGFIRVLSDNDRSYLDTLTEYIDRYELNVTPWAWGAWPYLNQEPSNKLSAFGEYMLDYFEQSQSRKAVTLYSGLDFTGESCTIESGKYTAQSLEKLAFDVTKLASASAKDDYYQYTITLYENEDFSGKSYTFVPDASNIGSDISGFEPKSLEIQRSVPENLLTGHAKVTAVGSEENQPIENVLDGKNSTYWKYTSESPVEIVISLDDVYALNGITLAHASEASMMSVFNASDYTVSVSTDGKTFTRVVDVTDNSLGLCEYRFEQVPACYIKIKLTKGSIINNADYYLTEVEAYGTKYTGSTENLSVSVGTYGGSSVSETDGGSQVLWIVLISVFGAVIVCSAVLTVLFIRRGKKRIK